jgi:hypothetical protein
MSRFALGSAELAPLAEPVEIAPVAEPAVPPEVDFDKLVERLVDELELEYLRMYGPGELGR